jgi:ATP-dependent Clp protease ATP-binding subunit ClpC
LNRIDEVIVFHKLAKEEIMVIVDLILKRLREQMALHETSIELTEAAKEMLVDKGYDPAMGARPLRRAIQKHIEDPLADFVLRAELPAGSTVMVEPASEGSEEEEVKLTVIEPKPVPTPVGVGAEGASPEAESEGDGESEASQAPQDLPDLPSLDPPVDEPAADE